MSILFTVPGLFGDAPSWLGGDPGLALKFLGGQFTPGKTLPKFLGGAYSPVTEHRPVSYNSWLPFWPGGWSGAATALDKALLAAPKNQQLIVTAHSQGAGGVGEWLKTKSATCPIESSRLLLVTMGVTASMKLPWFTGKRYPIIDVTVQWDTWADQADLPNSPNFGMAQSNTAAGDKQPNPNLHVKGYQAISLDGQHRENKVDTCTFMLFETPTVPLAGASRERIETAYARPYLGNTPRFVGSG